MLRTLHEVKYGLFLLDMCLYFLLWGDRAICLNAFWAGKIIAIYNVLLSFENSPEERPLLKKLFLVKRMQIGSLELASEKTDDRGKENGEASILEESRNLIRDGVFWKRVKKNWVIANREGNLGGNQKYLQENLWKISKEYVMSMLFPIIPQRPWYGCDMLYVYCQIKHIYYYVSFNTQVALKFLWVSPVFCVPHFWNLLLAGRRKGFEISRTGLKVTHEGGETGEQAVNNLCN